ncbi:MAG: transporter substrate-binding domain-containing protein, partial [Anaerotignum sp.]|nr:transporter substrate-binding domain-containing protein [Anaerotignum sp.]
YAMCFAKDSELTEQVNGALEELIADGTVQAIIDKYISAE